MMPGWDMAVLKVSFHGRLLLLLMCWSCPVFSETMLECVAVLPVLHKNLFYILYFYYLFLAVLGLHCCVWAFSSCGEWELLFVAVRGLLIAVASLVEHGL